VAKLNKSTADQAILELTDAWRAGLTEALLNRREVEDEDQLFWRAQRLTTLGLLQKICPGIGNELVHTISDEDAGLIRAVQERHTPNKVDFPQAPLDMLGQVYQRFLGQKLLVNNVREATFKTESRAQKSQGIFYTPPSVITYILEHNLSPLLLDKSPCDIKTLSILDPSCGSGAFLVYAFQHLLDWHLQAYLRSDPRQHEAQIRFEPQIQQWVLRAAERFRILKHHIYGVDLDERAVETAQLSLLRCAKPNSSAEASHLLLALKENIKCGNAVISANTPLTQELSLAEQNRLKPFDWKIEFKDIVNQGGFQLIIGNPPYRKELSFKEELNDIARFEFGKQHAQARMDLWYYFVHRGIELLRTEGRLSFIVNAYWVSSTGAKKLIDTLKAHIQVEEIFLLEKLDIFERVAGQHMILSLSNSAERNSTRIKRVPTEARGNPKPFLTGTYPISTYLQPHDRLFKNGRINLNRHPPALLELLDKLEMCPRLGCQGIVRQGIAENPGRINKKTNMRFGNAWNVDEGVFTLSQLEVSQLKIQDQERKLLRPYFDLCDIGRYWVAESPSLQIIYSTRNTWPKLDLYPALKAHLKRYQVIMEQRRETQRGTRKWWQLHWRREDSLWESPKILSVQMAKRPTFAAALRPAYVGFSVNVFVPKDASESNILYLTALLNSRLLETWFSQHAKQRGAGIEINGHVLEQAPIISFDSAPCELRETLVSLATSLMKLKAKQARPENKDQSSRVNREIESTEKQIDQLVYNLFGLQDPERRENAPPGI